MYEDTCYLQTLTERPSYAQVGVIRTWLIMMMMMMMASCLDCYYYSLITCTITTIKQQLLDSAQDLFPIPTAHYRCSLLARCTRHCLVCYFGGFFKTCCFIKAVILVKTKHTLNHAPSKNNTVLRCLGLHSWAWQTVYVLKGVVFEWLDIPN